MALENLVGPNIFISNLVRTNPAIDDPVSQGDDHLRGIKNATLNSFPNITGAVTMTQAQLNDIPNKAPLASPAFTDIPTAPTAAPGTNNNQLATTAFVAAAALDARTWKNVTGSRINGGTYTNAAANPIQICVTFSTGNQVDVYAQCTITVSGVVVGRSSATARGTAVNTCVTADIPAGASYSASGSPTLTNWAELS